MIKKTFCPEDIIEFANAVISDINGCTDNSSFNLFDKIIPNNQKVKDEFYNSLPWIQKALEKDLVFFMESDPAADNEEEIVFAYPGYRAIMFYRIAHLIHSLGFPFIARVISEHAHFLTGIDIHPGATIGTPFFIDHGTGIVIGETAIIGSHVKIYQGVTLGALSLAKGSKLKGVKRHPTVGDNVTIYSGASILGGDVSIGNNVVIGSNVFLLKSIPDNYRVILSEPELIVRKKD